MKKIVLILLAMLFTATLVCAATGDDCSDPITITIPADLPYSDAGQTTCGRIDDYDNTCLGSYDGGEDIIYELTVTSNVYLNISMDPDVGWTGMLLDDSCPPDPTTCLYKDTGSSGSRSIGTNELTPGTYYIMVDTWPSPDCIPSFDLTIEQYNPNYGQGVGTPLYYFANSTTGASGAPSQPSYSWVDISGTGTDVIGDLDDDNFVGPYPIGFTFNFFGNNYTEFYIGSNGIFTFGSGTPSLFNTTIPDAADPNDFIAWFWDDMNPTDTDVLDRHCYYGNSGGNLVVSFVHYPEYGADADGWLTAQIILYSGLDPRILLQYKEKGSSIDLTSCTVGIENATGDAGVQYLYDGNGGPIYNGSPIAVMFGTDENTLPVEILAGSFNAVYTSNELGMEYITVNWSTVTETDINGFNIYRSYEDDIATAGNSVNTSMIPGYGTTTEIHDYAFEDITADVYSTYYYWLEVVDIGGQTNFHGPISYIPEEDNPHPEDIPTTMLFGNYPNPVTNSTTIRYQLQGPLDAQNATICIYNILGELVRKVDGEDRQAVLDVSELPTGIYFYKLETDTYHSVKKMVIVR